MTTLRNSITTLIDRLGRMDRLKGVYTTYRFERRLTMCPEIQKSLVPSCLRHDPNGYIFRYHLAVSRPCSGGARASSAGDGSSAAAATVVSPMPGKVIRVMATAGDEVKKVKQQIEGRGQGCGWNGRRGACGIIPCTAKGCSLF